ncbi:MAG TPA: asparagine synthase (glutamine-hydrolyzing) [Syntrophales bacterium]|nr:asparagine synthase (glutamine-hydrolyzing) [Syntrophales bacterium]
MCGIAGIVDYRNGSPSPALLERMLALIMHRGPDSFGIYVDDTAGIASARLSIIDIRGGDQPICNETGSVWVVYNGEIYNYPDLRKELEKRGHRFGTNTDTEVLVHLYEEKGHQLIERLNGQFAFALWDSEKKELLLGRDRLGVRPLFYHQSENRIVFGSEIKTIFADTSVPRRLNPLILEDIFTCWAPVNSCTIFQDVRQIPPGHIAVFRSDRAVVRPYWNIRFPEGCDDSIPDRVHEEQIRELLMDAVRIRLRADVPVGAYLSGGLDSTYITSLVRKYFDNRLRTFSVGFSDKSFDETEFQNMAVGVLQTDNERIECSDEDIGRIFPKVIWHAEIPVLRTAPAPLLYLSGIVRSSGLKVVLTGEGADEIFGGYDIFKEDKIRRFWSRQPSSLWRSSLFQRIYPDIFSGDRKRAAPFLNAFFGKGLLETESEIYSHRIRWENAVFLKQFLSEEIRSRNSGAETVESRIISGLPAGFMNWHPLSRAQYLEISIFLSNYLLSSQGDRMSMANSVEGRYPYLDHRLVEYAFRLPPRLRISGLKEKYLLRKVAARDLPVMFAGRAKRPYRAPVVKCFLGGREPEYVRELTSEAKLGAFGYFDPVMSGRIMKKCRNAGGNIASEREGMAVTGIISTQLLHHMFISGFPVPAAGLNAPVRLLDRRTSGK